MAAVLERVDAAQPGAGEAPAWTARIDAIRQRSLAFADSLPRGARERVQLQPEASGPVHAPVAAGQVLGTLKVVLDGKVLRTEPLVALSALPEGNLWRRATDGVQLWIQDKP